MELRSTVAPMMSPRHRCQTKKTTELGWPDIASAFLIFLSVFITLLEACYISHTDLRIFANYAQAAFAACFCTQQGYNLYTFVSEQETSVAESVEAFFTHGKDAFWHVFDAVLNIVSILDIFVDTWEGRFVHGLAAMRVVRAFRLFRIFASNKFLNDFSRVMHTALLQMLNFCLVIVLSLTLASVVATNMLWDFPNEQVADSYADLGTTMWTLFKIMTMDGWTTKIQPCLELHPSLLYFFALFVFFSLSSISIVPAIFIELLIEERDKRKLEKRRKRKKRRRAMQRAISMREIADHDSSDSSCHSSSESSVSGHWGPMGRGSLFTGHGHPGQNELWFAINGVLLEWQKGHAAETSWSVDQDNHQYNPLPSFGEEFHELRERPEVSKMSTISGISDLQKDIQLMQRHLIEKMEQLENELIQRLERQLPKPSSSLLHFTERAQPERPASSVPRVDFTSRETSMDSFPDPMFWRETSMDHVEGNQTESKDWQEVKSVQNGEKTDTAGPAGVDFPASSSWYNDHVQHEDHQGEAREGSLEGEVLENSDLDQKEKCPKDQNDMENVENVENVEDMENMENMENFEAEAGDEQRREPSLEQVVCEDEAPVQVLVHPSPDTGE